MQKKKPQKSEASQDLDIEGGDYILGYSKIGVSKDQLPVTKSSRKFIFLLP